MKTIDVKLTQKQLNDTLCAIEDGYWNQLEHLGISECNVPGPLDLSHYSGTDLLVNAVIANEYADLYSHYSYFYVNLEQETEVLDADPKPQISLSSPELSIIRSFVKHQCDDYVEEWDDATNVSALLDWLYYNCDINRESEV